MSADGGAARATPGRRRATRPRRRARPWLLGLALLLLGVVLVSAWQAVSAYRHLQSAQDRLPALRAQLLADDPPVLRATLDAFLDDTGTARRAVHGPNWSLFSALPGLGDDVHAVQTVAEVADDLGNQAVSDLVELSAEVGPEDLRPVGGRVDLDAVRTARPAVVSAHRSAEAADRDLTGLDTGRLAAPLRARVNELSAQVRGLRAATRGVATAARLLPPMLGGDGPRHYLVLVQNNAEPRALGGIPGAAILLRADRGRIELVRQRPASSFGNFGQPVKRLSSAERALYGSQLGRYLQNVTATPDFPRAAGLAREMWRRGTGRQVDGVLSLDPVALGFLLEATGPVRLPDGRRLTGDNAARILLNQVYVDLPDPAAQDAFFAVAASAVFTELLGGDTDVRAAGEALAEATRQGRLMVWSARPGEQRELAGTAVGGELRGRDGDSPVVGVYLHDRSAAKIGYYEDLDVTVRERGCGPGGVRRLEAAVTVTSRVPADVAQLPDYLTGGGNAVRVGRIRSEVYVYAPEGGLVTDVRSGDRPALVTTHVHEGLSVAAHVVELGPGESVTLTFVIDTQAELSGPVAVRTTPGPADGRFAVLTRSCPD